MLFILEITQFKGITYALIEPGEAVTKIAGRNGQGKTSATDALVWLLTGTKGSGIGTPIKVGADQATVKGKLDDYTITRTKKPGGSDSLKIESKQGGKMPKPQAFLDAMLGDIGFDPGSFARAKPKDQKQMILDAFKPSMPSEDFQHSTGIHVPFAEVTLDRIGGLLDRNEEERRVIGRRKRDIEGELTAFDKDVITFPTESKSVADLEDRRKEAWNSKSEIINEQYRCDKFKQEMETIDEDINKRQIEIDDLNVQRRTAFECLETAKTKLKALPKHDDSFDFKAEVEAIEAHNAQVKERQSWDEARKRLARTENEYEDFTKVIESIRLCAEGMVASIDIEGLDLTGDPTVNGVPLEGLSDAEKIMVGIQVAIKQNPDIKIIRIKDGNHLDRGCLQTIADSIETEGYQLFVELVSDGPTGDAIYMYEGKVDSISFNPSFRKTPQ